SRSEAIGIARTNVERAQGEQVRARSGRLPQLTASASYDRALASEFSSVFGSDTTGPPCPPFSLQPSAPLNDRVSEIERAIDCGAVGNSFFGGGGDDEVDLPFGRKNTWRVNLLFSQSVYSGGRLGAQSDISLAGRDSAELALTGARAQLLFDVTHAFYDAALSDHLVQIAEATVAQAEATVRQVQASFEAGAQPEFELLRARVTRDNQQPVVIRRRAERDIAILRLKQLLDVPADVDLRLVAPLDGAVPPAPFAERIAAAEQVVAPIDTARRTAVKEVAALVRLREASLRAALAERRPSVSVTSNYSRVAYPSGAFPTGDFRTNWTLGAAVDFPILTGGRQRGSEMIARAELEGARLQLQQIGELAQLDVRSAQAELTAARAAFDASAGTIEQATRAYQIAEVRFQAGVSTQLELSDARLLLQQAEANRAQAARDLQVARARMALLPDLPLGASGANASQRAPAVPAAGGSATQSRIPASAAPQTNRPGGGNP
ncbi:MAG: TolC family protein, partial [Acidobacteria bacterium]|nr:TolC family protein [Acidobacteriota bacterium]